MRRNARVAFVLWRAGPPRGHEATPDRAVRRPYWGAANLRDCRHARLVSNGRNESHVLSLMSALEVNSGTVLRRQYNRQVNFPPEIRSSGRGRRATQFIRKPGQKRKPRLGGSGAFNVGLRGLGDLRCMSVRPQEGSTNSRRIVEFLLQAVQAAARNGLPAQWSPTWPSRSKCARRTGIRTCG